VADGAAAIAAVETADPAAAGLAYLAGLLHDIGFFLLVEHFPERHAEARALSRDEGISICEAERRGLGTTHAEVGGCLLGLWGAPDAIADAAAFHHRPSLSEAAGFSPLAAVHVADAVAAAQALRLPADAAQVDLDYLTGIHCAERLDRWREVCRVLGSPEAAS
jgi:HD-like signal output (HDOD) protein